MTQCKSLVCYMISTRFLRNLTIFMNKSTGVAVHESGQWDSDKFCIRFNHVLGTGFNKHKRLKTK